MIGVSIAPQAWLVERIGGGRFEVMTMVPAGASPESYQPADAQVTRLLSARAFLRIGVPFEEGNWFQALTAHAREGSDPKIRIFDQAAGIERRAMSSNEHADSQGHGGPLGSGHAGADPHLWLSPRLLRRQARTVEGALAGLDPAYADLFAANLEVLDGELAELDRTLRAKLAPLAGTPFFVFHPSWGYFADDYGLRMIAIEVAGKEPNDRELTVLQEQAREAGATVIFVQPQVAGRTARAVADAVGARLLSLDPLAADVPANLLRTADALLAAHAAIRSPS